MTVSIPLVCGDPDKKGGATFSRFVYPFAYRLKRTEKNKAEHADKNIIFYEEYPNDTCDVDVRKRYYSHETGTILFDHAKWLRIPEDCWKKTKWAEGITVHCRGRNLTLAMQAPSLVLFECGEKSSEDNILQTGFLFVDIYFPVQADENLKPELDDLLKINDFFRYYRCPYSEHAEIFGELFRKVPVDYEQGSHRTVGDENLTDNEAYHHRWTNLLDFRVFIKIKPSSPKEEFFYLDHDEKEGPTYADDRTYVWSAAILEKGVDGLPFLPDDGDCGAHQYGHWVKFLNVDPPASTPNTTHREISSFEQSWAKERTYHRWEELGTWYGFSYHSGVLMGSVEVPPPIVEHFREIYFDMVILLFYVRVTLFRFSKKLSEIARKAGKEQTESYQKLRKKFGLFSIIYRFPLLSNQQQAVEMYTLARKYFDIDDIYEEIKEEIDTAHQLEEMERQSQSTERMERLTNFGIPVATGALIASIFGMNADQYPFLQWIWLTLEHGIPNWLTLNSKSISFAVLFSIVLIAAVISFCWVYRPLSKKRGKR